MNNNWKQVWTRRNADVEILRSNNKEKIFLELKRSNGFDVVGYGLSLEALFLQYEETKKYLSYYPKYDEYEAILKEVDGYHLEYQLTTTLDNIQALYKKALEFSQEAKRVKNLSIDEAIAEIMQDKK